MARYSFHAFHMIRIFKRVLLVFGETLPYFLPFFRDKLPQNPSQASMSFWESSAMAAAAQLRTQVLLHHLELDKKMIYGDRLSHTLSHRLRCVRKSARFPPLDQEHHRRRGVLLLRLIVPMTPWSEMSAPPKTESAPPNTGRAHPQTNRSNGILIRHNWQKK